MVILAYLDPAETELSNVFTAAATEHHHEFVFGLTNDLQLAKADGLTIPSVVCYKNRDGDHTAMNGYFNRETLENFLQYTTPLVVGEITKRNIDTYMAAGKPIAYIFASTSSQRDNLRREITPVAKKYSQYINFGVIDAVEYSEMAAGLDLSPGMFPAFVVHNILNDQVFPFDQRRRISKEAVEGHILDIVQGKARPGPLIFGEDEGGDVGVEAERVRMQGHDEL